MMRIKDRVEKQRQREKKKRNLYEKQHLAPAHILRKKYQISSATDVENFISPEIKTKKKQKKKSTTLFDCVIDNQWIFVALQMKTDDETQKKMRSDGERGNKMLVFVSSPYRQSRK